MPINHWLKEHSLAVFLPLAMAATRFHHFGSAFSLPDASLAVFFFAGFYPGRALFFMLLAEAALIDYLAIAGGTDSFCISPAYVFLLPAYAVMWGAGRRAAALDFGGRAMFVAGATLLAATSVAFLISNGGFYLFSGRFTAPDLSGYWTGVQDYYPPFLASTAFYALGGYVFKYLCRRIRIDARNRHAY